VGKVTRRQIGEEEIVIFDPRPGACLGGPSMHACRLQEVCHSRTSDLRFARVDFKGSYAASQRVRRELVLMPLKGSEQAPCRFDDEGAISAPRLKKPRLGEIGVAVPTNGVENLTDHLRLGVHSAPAMQGVNLGSQPSGSLSGSV
jgi:hypothetical protein